MITIKVFESYDEMSAYAAEIVKEVINSTEKPVIGLATGSSPIGLYKKLIEMNKNKQIDFSQVTSINLDEYVGLSSDHPQSYSYFMNEYLFDHINIDKANTFVPNGLADDLEQECRLYDQRLRDLGYADIQILGIGQNGHIGFNEPSAKLNTNTNIVNLTPKTIKDNARFFDSIDDVPKQGITLGLEGIFKAKKIVLVANGLNKAEVCKSFADEYIDTQVPASLLKLHKDITVCLDKEAASLIEK
ncbi:MAG: glucosamine-6-phosphate deaminase [Clostridiaceae bacterium]|nr:glucosamine-6-phosphate deaminase [Clostridiaceae bacterium]